MVNYPWPLAKQMGFLTLTVGAKIILIGLSISFIKKGSFFFFNFKEKIEQRLFQPSKGHHMFENKPVVRSCRVWRSWVPSRSIPYVISAAHVVG